MIDDYGTMRDDFGPINIASYPREVSIPVEIGITYTNVEVFVPVMELAVGGAGTQFARLWIDWSALGVAEGPETPDTGATESPVSSEPEGSAPIAVTVTPEVKETTTAGKVVESTVETSAEAVTQAANTSVTAAKAAAETRNADATETVVAEVKITATALPAGTNASEVTETVINIPKEVVEAVVAESDKVKAANESASNVDKANVELVLTVESGLASVTLDSAELAALLEIAGADAIISVTAVADARAAETLPTAQANAVPADKVPFAIEIGVDGAPVTGTLASPIAVTVSHPAPSAANKKLVVWYVATDGTKTKIDATYADGKLTFVTDRI